MVLANILVYTMFFSGIALPIGVLIYAAALLQLLRVNVRDAPSSTTLLQLLKNRISPTFTIARWWISICSLVLLTSIIAGVIFIKPIA